MALNFDGPVRIKKIKGDKNFECSDRSVLNETISANGLSTPNFDYFLALTDFFRGPSILELSKWNNKHNSRRRDFITPTVTSAGIYCYVAGRGSKLIFTL